MYDTLYLLGFLEVCDTLALFGSLELTDTLDWSGLLWLNGTLVLSGLLGPNGALLSHGLLVWYGNALIPIGFLTQIGTLRGLGFGPTFPRILDMDGVVFFLMVGRGDRQTLALAPRYPKLDEELFDHVSQCRPVDTHGGPQQICCIGIGLVQQ